MNDCVICGKPIAEPRTREDWRVFTVPQLGNAHYSCYQILDEIKAEESKAEMERLVRLSKERLARQ